MWQSTKIHHFCKIFKNKNKIQIGRVTICVHHMDSCHSYTYVGNDREVHKNFVMWFVTWKPEAQVMYQLSTSSYTIYIFGMKLQLCTKAKGQYIWKKRMYYYWVIFLYSFQEVTISVLYCLKLTQCCGDCGPTIQWLCIYHSIFNIGYYVNDH
jgi:hypothetical protein